MKKIFLIGLVYLLVVFSGYGQIRLVSDLVPGTQSSNPFEFIEHDGLLFFRGSSATNAAIYAMDSAENISIVWEQSGSVPDNMIVFANELYFKANNSLHRLNKPYGTGSTIIDTSISVWLLGNVYNGELYFSGEQNQVDPLNPNYELWAFNGNSFRLVEEESSISFYPRNFVQHLGELFFVGDEIANVNGQPEETTSIYKTDGTTVELSSFLPTLEIAYLTSFQSELYFLGRQGTFPQPYNLWYSNQNATAAFGDELNFAFGLAVFDNELYFFNEDNNTLFKSSQLGSFVPVTIESGTEYPSSAGFPLIGEDFMAFEGSTAVLGSELYILGKGTPIAFTEDYNPGTGSFTPVYGAFFINKLYLTGDDGTGIGRELHVYDPLCTTTVDIEDPNFEEYLETQLNVGDGILGNKKVCKEKIETITELRLTEGGQFNGQGFGIEDLSGIEHFEALELLWVQNNNLTSLDLRQNTNLRDLRAFTNNISLLNVEGLVQLTVMGLNFNTITDIDFSSNTALEILDIENNSLNSISLGNNTNVTFFRVTNNSNLQSLDISGIDANLTTFSATGLSSLSCIQVSSEQNANSQAGWSKDATTEYSTNCGNQPFTITTSLGGDVVDTDPEACCTAYEIEEGQLLEIYFESDNTATDGEEYIVQLSLSGGEADGADISNRQDSPNLQYTYTVKANDPDNTMQIDIVDDGIPEQGGENLRLTFTPVGSNFAFSGTTVYNIKINDKPTTPFEVNSSISGNVTGSEPNYTIEEGQIFNLNFNADATASDGTVYNPIITVSQNGVDATADFTIDDLNRSFTVSVNNPDGSILFTPNDDGNDTGDEVYTISIASENTGLYTIAQPTTFTITVTDKPVDTVLLRTTIVGATPNGEDYEITEGQTLGIQIEAINGTNGETFTIPLDLSNSTAQAVDYSGPETSFDVTVQEGTPDGTLNYQIIANDGDDAGEILDIILDQPLGYQWEDIGGDGFIRFQVTINEQSTETFTVTPSISGDIIGTSPNFEITEGQTFNLNFNAGTAALNGTNYSPLISVTKDGFETTEDFTIDDIFKSFSVSDDNPDGFIEFIVSDDGVNEGDEVYIIDIFSENEELYTIEGTSTFQVTLKNKINPNAPFVVNISFDGNIRKDEVGSPECCFWYFVEEGEKITINYNAEEGAPNGTIYQVQLDITNNGFAPDGSVYIPFDGTDDYSFTENVNDVLNKTVNQNEIDGFTQLTIADNDDDTNFLEYFTLNFDSENVLNLIGADESGNFTFVIIEAPFPEFSATIPTAREASEEEPTTKNGEVSFKVENPEVEDILVQFRLSGTADYLVDYVLSPMNLIETIDSEAQIFSVQLDENGEAKLQVIPIDEDENQQEPEPTETVVFTIEDSFGYKIQDGEFAQVDILDSDRAPNFVVLADVPSERELIFEDSSLGATSFFEVLLLDENGQSFNAASEFKVGFELKPENGQPIVGSDFRIFDGNVNNQQDISGDSELFVTIRTGENKGFISVEALPDPDVEPENERITVQLTSGPDYAVNQIDKTVSITIVSEQRGNVFDPSQLSAKVFSPTCPGFNVGEILVENDSQFDFMAELYQNNIKINELPLNQDSNTNFQELNIGDYEIRIRSVENPEIIPPTFRVTIRDDLNENRLLASTIDQTLKMASLVVSGSSFYHVFVNEKRHSFEFENRGENTLTFPIQNGLNTVEVSGEAICQGKLKTEILLADYKVYPNPTESSINFTGLMPNTPTKIILFNTAGQRYLEHTENSDGTGSIEINISKLPSGTYFGKILSNEEELFQINLLKK